MPPIVEIEDAMDIVEEPPMLAPIDPELPWEAATLKVKPLVVVVAEGLPVGVGAATAAVGDPVTRPPAQANTSS